MALNRSDKSRILRRYFPGMTRNSEMSTEPSNSVNFYKLYCLIGVAFWCAAIVGLGYFSVRAIQQGYYLIIYHRDIASNIDRISLILGEIEVISLTDTGVIVGWLAGGFIFLGWSVFLTARTIPILVSWFKGAEELSSLPYRIASNFYPLFKLAGMALLFSIAGLCFFYAITDAIPQHISDYSSRSSRSVQQGEVAGIIILLLVGIVALAGSLYLVLRLIADAVKSFLRNDGVL